ncbi:DUF4350 domain-containing protein [Mucilaginibacter sp.]|uniref:DUF4350 domain-containing protein n=1 Tax=Mucilaginibacter sp. TaxID=1882438 RepID=UPI003AFFEA0D
MNKLFLTLAFVAAFVARAKAQEKVVTLDSYFNNEHRKTADGAVQSFHYKWEEKDNNGFSIFGEIFKNNGARLQTLYEEPTLNKLKKTTVYIIVDPDTKKESPDPKYISQADANVIAQWVKAGGTLLLFANDSANVELPNFNKLAEKFGMHFNNQMINHVTDDQHFADGAVIPVNNPVFKTAAKIFMKDACSITVKKPAEALLYSGSAVIIAEANFGKGKVVAVGDPWLYNEYVNGRLPAGFDNDKAAADLVKWLMK